MSMVSNMREIEDTVYECLKANGMKLSRGDVVFDLDFRVKATTEDDITFNFGLTDRFLKSGDGKYRFDIEPFKKDVKPLGE